jgi:hypothetical protein
VDIRRTTSGPSDISYCFFGFFNACILRYYLLKPLTSLICSLNVVFPGLKMWDTFTCATANFSTYFIISIKVLENVPPDAGLQKRDTFSTLNVGLARTGNRTRATCVASSGTICSAIHYAFLSGYDGPPVYVRRTTSRHPPGCPLV